MREPLEEGRVQVAVVPQHHQQGSEGTVDQLDVRLGVICHELVWRGGEEGGRVLECNTRGN